MHNKLFIADGRLALIGGRNIGDDYFERGGGANFIDLDVLATGAGGARTGHGASTPSGTTGWPTPSTGLVPATAGDTACAPDAVAGTGRHRRPDSVAVQIESGRLDLRFAAVQVFADPPAKASRTDAAEKPGEAMAQALEVMSAAGSRRDDRHAVLRARPARHGVDRGGGPAAACSWR